MQEFHVAFLLIVAKVDEEEIFIFSKKKVNRIKSWEKFCFILLFSLLLIYNMAGSVGWLGGWTICV